MLSKVNGKLEQSEVHLLVKMYRELSSLLASYELASPIALSRVILQLRQVEQLWVPYSDSLHLSFRCLNKTYKAIPTVCKWDYNGQGFEYQIVAGPVFIVIYTFAGIFISFAADRYNRKMMLAACLILWSTMTILTGFIKEYWQLVLLRFGLGFGYVRVC